MGGGGRSVFFGTTHSLLRARSPSLTHPLACWGARPCFGRSREQQTSETGPHGVSASSWQAETIRSLPSECRPLAVMCAAGKELAGMERRGAVLGCP